MKKYLRKIISVVLCLTMLASISFSTFAANTRGITFDVSLDNATLIASEEDQTVVMKLKASEAISFIAMGLVITKTSPLEIVSIEGGDEQINLIKGTHYDFETGKVGWDSTDVGDVMVKWMQVMHS